MVKTKKSSKLDLSKRIIYFVSGMIIASTLLVFSFQWDLLPFEITGFGINITPYALAFFIVLIGVFASTLIKSGLRGKRELDV